MKLPKLYHLALNPWVVLTSLAAGFVTGVRFPQVGMTLGFVGDVYVDLLKMVALPFMVSAVIFSLQKLFREGGSGKLIGSVGLVFAGFSLAVALLGVLTLELLQPGANLPVHTMQTFGDMVGHDLGASDTVMTLLGVDEVAQSLSVSEVLASLVPSNIFAALANGETLKALVFALLFGLAVGKIPARISEGLAQSLETVYHACQLLMRGLNYPLPLILFCMSAAQIAKTGVGPLYAMGPFVLAFFAASALVLVIALAIIWKRSQATLGQTLVAMEGPFALALATRSSAACMPSMIESLADQLGFSRSRVELLVPLSVSLLRIGPMVYYVCAAMFIGQMYGKPFGAAEWAIVVVASVLAGFASAGMSGLLTVSLVGLTCRYLGLPFEAAFILFAAVDPLCDMLRTLVLVLGNSAAVTLICPRPLKL